MTVDKMKGGQQTPRNTNFVRILRHYGMMDDRGMGIRRKVIPLMREPRRLTAGLATVLRELQGDLAGAATRRSWHASPRGCGPTGRQE